jgi:hypothetical protein
MATFTINTRNHGPKTFFVPDNGGYVRLESAGRQHGTLGSQICYGGGFRGNTVTADRDTLETVARKWWKDHLRVERAS